MSSDQATKVRIGVTPFGGESRVGAANLVDEAVTRARQAVAAGITELWFSQRFEYDSIALAGHVGREVPEITVGTSVVPIPGLDPLYVSTSAQTAQAATHGRFTLGLGLGWNGQAQYAQGLTHDRPAQRIREFLSALRPMLHEGSVDFHGELITAVAPHTAVPGAHSPVPVLVAAMAPRALKATAELAEGTITFLASPAVIAEHIAPVIAEAAQAAGRPAPRIVAMLPAVVTDDVAAARAAFAKEFTIYDQMPSYVRVVQLGGRSRAAEMGVAGDEETVASAIQEYVAAGVTEVIVSRTNVLGDEDRLRTWRLLGELSQPLDTAVERIGAAT